MINVTIEQLTGNICTPNGEITHAYKDTLFEQFSNHTNVIHKNSVTQYTLSDPIIMFEETYRLSLYFDQHILKHCVFQLMSGPAHDMDEYPSHGELQDEFSFLVGLYSEHFPGTHKAEFSWKHTWRYQWGEITLMIQPQNSNVISDLSWISSA